ncbi:type II toxin-antitoxin system YhaV family toxin [Chamaesiphon sp. OTE_8_metabat_110]|uniref:type II toxin-antitoxin system YhaV family toxin n=1 Tax=Chamaesiphon sp. OTE_8_metabat_110 TaxID=2964696 RepID=UPI00286D2EA9|nr:type II toxin-antitoxin system YhaV family toxin [Chamaesiphon sp. OTE_8_metabat_110]
MNTQLVGSIVLRERVKQLKAELPEADYLGHPDVKLLAAVMVGIKEKIVLDPLAAQFALTGSLQRYGRINKFYPEG